MRVSGQAPCDADIIRLAPLSGRARGDQAALLSGRIKLWTLVRKVG